MSGQPRKGRLTPIDPARTEALIQLVLDADTDERAVDAIIFRVVAEDFVLAARQLRAAREVIEEVRLHLAGDMIPCGVCNDLVGKYDRAVSP